MGSLLNVPLAQETFFPHKKGLQVISSQYLFNLWRSQFSIAAFIWHWMSAKLKSICVLRRLIIRLMRKSFSSRKCKLFRKWQLEVGWNLNLGCQFLLVMIENNFSIKLSKNEVSFFIYDWNIWFFLWSSHFWFDEVILWTTNLWFSRSMV